MTIIEKIKNIEQEIKEEGWTLSYNFKKSIKGKAMLSGEDKYLNNKVFKIYFKNNNTPYSKLHELLHAKLILNGFPYLKSTTGYKDDNHIIDLIDNIFQHILIRPQLNAIKNGSFEKSEHLGLIKRINELYELDENKYDVITFSMLYLIEVNLFQIGKIEKIIEFIKKLKPEDFNYINNKIEKLIHFLPYPKISIKDYEDNLKNFVNELHLNNACEINYT